jgi:YD repeat-containing protein
MIARALCAWGLSFALTFTLTYAQAATYSYDANGRIRSVTNSSGDSRAYVYDALGNLVRVVAAPAGQLAIFAFTPAQGPVGTSVTIFGQGFMPTGNVVTFHGTTATVTSATPTQLVAVVPSAATTGPITVIVSGGSVTSPDSFVVTGSDAAPPTITGISPLVAAIGSTVSVTGTNLAPVVNGTTVRLNSQELPSASVSLTDTLGTFAAPANIGGGKISVTTPYGLATSTQDLVIAPSSINPTSIQSSNIVRLVEDGPSGSLTINPNEAGIFLFDANFGDHVSLQASSVSTSNPSGIAYILLDTHGSQISNPGTIKSSSPTIHFPALGAPGTYSLFITPGSAGGSITAQLEVDTVLVADGVSPVIATTTPGRNERLFFVGNRGDTLGMGLVLNAGSGTPLSLAVNTPEGGGLASAQCSLNGGCAIDLWAAAMTGLPESGAYTATVSPPSGGLMNFTTTLSSDVTATLTPDLPFALNLPRAGQNGRLTFTLASPQTVAVSVSGINTTPVNQVVAMNVYTAAGAAVSGGAISTSGTNMIVNLPNLAVGTYTVVIGGQNVATSSMQVTLLSGATGVLSTNGSPVTLSTTTPNQKAYLTFTGSAGDKLGLGMALNTGSGTPLSISILQPTGTGLLSGTCLLATGCALDVWTSEATGLPVSGTYTVVVSPPSGGTMNFTTTLSTDLTATLTPNTPFALNLPRAGQNGRLSFTLASPQTVAVSVSGMSTAPINQPVALDVYTSTGAAVSGGSTSTSGTNMIVNLPNLAAGTYTVIIGGQNAATSSMQVTLVSGATGVLSVNGSPVTLSTTTPNQRAYLTFTGSAGDKLGLGMALNTGSGTPLSISILQPTGTGLLSNSCPLTTGCSIDVWTSEATGLPVSGTYTVVVSPPSGGIVNFTTTLSSDVAATLGTNTPYALTLSRAGQNGRLTFTTTSTQSVTVSVSGIATTPANQNVIMTVYSSAGTQVGNKSTTTSSMSLILTNLAAGTYTIIIGPQFTATATMQVQQSGS